MREDAGQAEPSIRLATAPVPGSAAPSAEAAIELPTLGLNTSRARWARPAAPITFGPRAGRIGLAALLLGTLLVVACAAAGPSVLVPRSAETFPNWEAGPLHLVTTRL